MDSTVPLLSAFRYLFPLNALFPYAPFFYFSFNPENQSELAVSLHPFRNNQGLTGFDSKDSGIVSMPGL
jgi:hypothetical protein